jgi:integrase
MKPKNIGENSQFSASVSHNIHTEKLERRRKPSVKYLMAKQIDALLRVIKNVRDQAIFRVAFHHGLRASEIGMIQMADYTPGNRAGFDRLYVERLKHSVSGDLYLVPEAAHALRMWLKRRGAAPGPVFLSRHQLPITRRRLDQLMKHYCKAAGIPEDKSHFHCLKHSCATILLSDKRLPIVQVQRHLGHKSIANTMIYAQLTDQADEERAALLKNWK